MKMKAKIVTVGKGKYIIIPDEVLKLLKCDTFDMQWNKEKKELRLTPVKSKKTKELSGGKKKALLPMSYKGYLGTYKPDKKAKIYHGEVIGIQDVITFQSAVETDMEKAFHDSIDDYLAFCAKNRHKPNKTDKETWLQSQIAASEDFMSKRIQPKNQSRPSLDSTTERPESEINQQIEEYAAHLRKNKKSLKGFNTLSEENWPK